MSNLEKDLKEWSALGLISLDQAKRIHDHESAKPEGSWILPGLLILGVVIIGIGIISLIAANWNQIPDPLKLAGNFLFLVALAFAALHSWKKKKAIQFETLLVFFIIICLASIGLIAQIYHLGGKLHQTLLFWSLITFPPILSARNMFAPFLWGSAFLGGIVFTTFDSVILQPLFQKNEQAVFMTIPLLCAGLTTVSKHMAGEIGFTRAFRAWTLISGLIALFAIESHRLFSITLYYKDFTAYFLGYLLATLAVFSIWQNLEYRKAQKALLLAMLGFFLMLFHLPLFRVNASITYAVFTIIILGLMTFFLATLRKRRLFQWFLFLLSMRFLVLYFQALGGLATTGIGLTLSGGLVVAIGLLWNKYKTALAVWAERWAQ